MANADVSEDIEVSFKHEYMIKFIIDGSGNCDRIAELGLDAYERIFFVLDKNVSAIYQDTIVEKLVSKMEYFIYTVKPEECSKSIGFYPKLVEFLEQNTAGRYDAVIVVGGGIVIDLVSFTVSTYMRGLPFYIIATTLIGQTDASTAGKTCLNSFHTKNLLGTFYYPKAVYNSIEMLRTCSKRITRQGLSEAFKYSLLTDGVALKDIIMFSNCEFDAKVMERIVRKTIEARILIRKIDPLASNLGHTFGHALEKYLNYEILHGDAILAGTVMAMMYGVQKGLMDEDEKEQIFDLMQEAKLNIYIPSDLEPQKLVEFMRKDKKSSSKKLHLVMIHGIGKPYRDETPFFSTDYEDVENFLNEFVKHYFYTKDDYLEYLKCDVLV